MPQFRANGKTGATYADKDKAQSEAVVVTRQELAFIGDCIAPIGMK